MIAKEIEQVTLTDERFPILPQEWQLTRVGDNFDIQQGKQVSAKTRAGSNVMPFLRTVNVLWGKVDLGILDQMHFSYGEMQRLELLPDDLLTCEGGDVGRTALWNGEKENIFFQNHLHRLRRKPEADCDPRFFMFWMIYSVQYTHLYTGEANRTTIPNLSKSRLSSFLFPLPPLTEQRAIARVLSTVQAAITKQDKLIQTTQALKKALMHKLFTEGLNGEPTKETEIGLVPESWDVMPIGQVFTTTSKPRAVDVKGTAEVPFIPMDFVPDRGIYCSAYTMKSSDSLTSGTFVENGDFLLAKITPSFENGKQCILKIPYNWAYATTEVIPVKEMPGVSSKLFLFYYLQRPQVRDRLAGLMEGTTGRQRLNKTTLFKYYIPLPSIEEQNDIGHKLAVLDKKIDQQHTRKRILESVFRTLLHEIMTGQRRL